MNFYTTTGTPDFMETIRNQHGGEEMVLLYGPGNALLMHETEGKTVFQTPKQYEVIGSAGPLARHGYYVINNIPVTDEGRPIFEHRFENRAKMMDGVPGFLTYRLLRPVKSDTYRVLTAWNSKDHYELWKGSKAFEQAHAKQREPLPAEKVQHIFTSASYVTEYTTEKAGEEEDE
ncbi:antibiotic biosynthesis monooxygenase family protein [Bhargavaea ullalensis]|uniref:Heme-degrading monooxygenase HmoA n=1 Tax=Bhargavaea ullalensis TaxID=1265685 RepID=A0ABV2GEU9_9BACL